MQIGVDVLGGKVTARTQANTAKLIDHDRYGTLHWVSETLGNYLNGGQWAEIP